MDTTQPTPLLGGLSPQQFMQRHWQKKPLLVRQAIAGFTPLLDRAALFALAEREEVESRLLQCGDAGWKLRHGPLPRRALPPIKKPNWTVLVQGVDLHVEAVHRLMQRFRFVPDARLDDVMISWASDGGGVGPHFDSYDVFLLQAYGQRRWRIGRQKDKTLVEGLPLRILAHFEPEEEFVLDPGDMLYLPPGWAHDGIAVGECMTYSIGFRQPKRGELARELLQRLAEDAEEAAGETPYRDPRQPAVATPGAIPGPMLDFARDALQAVLDDPEELACLLGEYLSEPKPQVVFAPAIEAAAQRDAVGVVLDRRTRMLYDEARIFINGESYLASGRDAQLMRALADARRLDAQALRKASRGARALVQQWKEAGWLHDDDTTGPAGHD